MRGIAAIAVGLFVTVLSFGQAAAGWTTIFNGSNLTGWNPVGNANWKLAEGAVQADGGSGFLVSSAFDKRPDQSYRTGGIVDVAKPLAQINAGGRWNTLEITARGPRLMVTLNGTRTVDVEHTGHARGPVALQYGAGIVKFRNVQIRAL